MGPSEIAEANEPIAFFDDIEAAMAMTAEVLQLLPGGVPPLANLYLSIRPPLSSPPTIPISGTVLRKPIDMIADGVAEEKRLPKRGRFKKAGNEVWYPRQGSNLRPPD